MRNIHFKVMMGLICIVLVNGCASESTPGGLTEREAGALAGGGMGAGLGAIIGSQTGHTGAGTAIGGGAGAVTGALIGEAQRRQKETIKKEVRQEMMQQQYQPQYTPQPYSSAGQPVVVPTQGQEIHTKYNPRTGQTFPDNFQYDPNTGEKLELIKR